MTGGIVNQTLSANQKAKKQISPQRVNVPVNYKFSEHQENLRMQIRMHIIEESKAEWREMPQEYYRCPGCQFIDGEKMSEECLIGQPDFEWKCCRECGTLIDSELSCGSIKEPRFHKNTHHMDPMLLYQQMCIDEINKLKLVTAPEDRNEMEEL